MDNESYSEDFAMNNLNKVFVDIQVDNTMFRTKLKIVLKDLTNKVVFESFEGISRSKEYKVAYQESLRAAFGSFDALHHKYVEKNETENQNIIKTNTAVDVVPQNSQKAVEETTSEVIRNRLSVVKTENGFDLYSIENKLVLSAKSTNVKNVFIATGGIEKGVLLKKDDLWYFEYYREGSKKLMSENLMFNF